MLRDNGEKHDLKVVLPGEMGVATDGTIGTFACGAQKGCRGYLVYDMRRALAGVAHVDFYDQDLNAVKSLVNWLSEKGASDLMVKSTRNADLETIINKLGLHRGQGDLPDPEFVFDVQSKEVTGGMALADKKMAFFSRKGRLRERLLGGDHSLLEI